MNRPGLYLYYKLELTLIM